MKEAGVVEYWSARVIACHAVTLAKAGVREM